jgi:hypothetical protein
MYPLADGIDQLGAGAVEDIASSQLPAARLEEILVVSLRAILQGLKDRENGANAEVGLDIGGAI